jgi:hypothetical protein
MILENKNAKPNRISLGIWDTTLEAHLNKTGLGKLPQMPLLQKTLDDLAKKDLIEEAYLRGSFSFGSADYLSDIDLFTVVEAEKLYETHTEFQQTLSESGNIIIGCHDKFVKDYGGIGFMYLCEDKNTANLYQFDIYYAMKGVPPKTLLFDAPRIYSKNKEYCWVEENDTDVSPLPSSAKDFITRHTEETKENAGVVSAYNDLIVGLFIMDKHLKRQQIARAFNDNFQNMNALIDILRFGMNKHDFQVPLYAYDEMSKEIAKGDNKDNQEFALQIREIMSEPISKKHVEDMFMVGMEMIQTFAPQYYEQNKDNINLLNKYIFKTPFTS